MTYSIQHLLLMLLHIPLMSKLYFKRPYSIQHLLQQLLHIICLYLGYSLAPGTLSGGII